ncbi:MAG: hypothetical protein FWD60_03785 [Candidatus Azobacteroides sp.]|nr:hypothetical protein [Candidatus Azobacteroides sp.]
MKKTVIILITLAFIAGSCGQTKKNQNQITEPFSIASKDSIVFNHDVFWKYKPGGFSADSLDKYNKLFFFEKGSSEDARYGFQYFIFPKNSDYTSIIFLIDSIPMKNGMYGLLFSYWNYDWAGVSESYYDSQAWLVNYSSDNKYIDSRMVYREGKVDDRKFNIYSNFYLSDQKLNIFDEDDTFGLTLEVPVMIRKDGTFEAFPDTPFAKTNIASHNCNENGLHGKFPLKQKWTLVSFRDNRITKNIIETKRNYLDCTTNLSTIFTDRWEDFVEFDLAFKGVYADADIKMMPLVAENDEDIIRLIGQNPPYEKTKTESIQLYSFTYGKNKFWVAYYTFTFQQEGDDNLYTALVGVTPGKKVVLLADYCVYENSAYIFRLKNEFYLYANSTSCGEGAVGTRHVYKLAADFEPVFEDTIGCD